jgi:PIN domain nuclease of toxin-antitoxin system
MLNLDTHILIRAFTGDLRGREASLLRSRRWGISGIVLWELATLAQTGKIEFDLGDQEVVQTLSGVQTWPWTWSGRSNVSTSRAIRPTRSLPPPVSCIGSPC